MIAAAIGRPCVSVLAAAVSEDRKYASSHEWAKVDGDVATIGISDFAQVLLSWQSLLESVALVLCTAARCKYTWNF